LSGGGDGKRDADDHQSERKSAHGRFLNPERSLATARLAATGQVMPLILFACFSGLLNFVSGLFLAERERAAA
jgi:hypothetical protein